MNKQYSTEFKLEAVKIIEKPGKSVVKVAQELGVKPSTMQSWVNEYRKSPSTLFIVSEKLSPEDEKLRKLENEIRDLKEENGILKKRQPTSPRIKSKKI